MISAGEGHTEHAPRVHSHLLCILQNVNGWVCKRAMFPHFDVCNRHCATKTTSFHMRTRWSASALASPHMCRPGGASQTLPRHSKRSPFKETSPGSSRFWTDIEGCFTDNLPCTVVHRCRRPAGHSRALEQQAGSITEAAAQLETNSSPQRQSSSSFHLVLISFYLSSVAPSNGVLA